MNHDGGWTEIESRGPPPPPLSYNEDDRPLAQWCSDDVPIRSMYVWDSSSRSIYSFIPSVMMPPSELIFKGNECFSDYYKRKDLMYNDDVDVTLIVVGAASVAVRTEG